MLLAPSSSYLAASSSTLPGSIPLNPPLSICREYSQIETLTGNH